MKVIAALTTLALLSGAAQAQETRYVTDILQLGLYTTQDGSGAPIRNLVSGTKVTVLERIPNFARVRTPDGKEGWVKSAFLVTDKPAQLRVAEVEAKAAALSEALEQAKAERESAARDSDEIVAEAKAKLAEATSSMEELARLREENSAYEQRVESFRGALPWPWVAGALLVALGVGFLTGHWWLDASIRRRHGGFRVY
jgi:SH3 domain protein